VEAPGLHSAGLGQLRAVAGEVSRRSSAALISATLRGSTSTAAPPVISGSDDRLEVITGTPAAMAWATGKPKPS